MSLSNVGIALVNAFADRRRTVVRALETRGARGVCVADTILREVCGAFPLAIKAGLAGRTYCVFAMVNIDAGCGA